MGSSGAALGREDDGNACGRGKQASGGLMEKSVQGQEGAEQRHDAVNIGRRRLIKFAQPLVLVLVAAVGLLALVWWGQGGSSAPDDGTALLVLTLICCAAIGLAWLLAREARRTAAELRTYREGAEQTIEAATTAAEKAKAATIVLLGTVSHELRTQVQTVLASIELLEEEQSRSGVDTSGTMPLLRRAADALEAQLGDLLSLARAEAPAIDTVGGIFSFGAACFGAAYEAGRQLAASKGLEFRLVGPTVNWVVSGDAGRVRQIVNNLVANACAYTQSGRVEVHVGELDKASAEIRVDVLDTGPGIEASHLPLLFKPFTRLHAGEEMSERKRKGGMGLAIVKRLAEGMGGRVGVESAAGQGSKFSVWLKVSPVMQWRLRSAGESVVLVINEDSDVKDSLEEFAAAAGATVKTTEHGEDGLKKWHSTKADIVLVDLQLPGISGVDVAKRIRRACDGKERPVLVAVAAHVDAYGNVAEVFDAVLRKPVDRGAVGGLIRRLTADKATTA